MWLEWWAQNRLVTGILFAVAGIAWTGIKARQDPGVSVAEIQDQVGLSLLLIGALLLAEGLREAM